MNRKQPAIQLQPRSILSCIDFAILFIGVYLPLFVTIWAVVTIPAALITWMLAEYLECGMGTMLIIFYLGTIPQGVMVALVASATLKGETPSVRQLRDSFRQVGWRLVFQSLGVRLFIALGSAFLLLLPGLYLAMRWRYYLEKKIMYLLGPDFEEKESGNSAGQKWEDPIGHFIVIAGFGCVLFFVLFITFDLAAYYLFGFPIFWGHILQSGVIDSDEFFSFFWSYPHLQMLILATAFMVYIGGRLAWFFTYVDYRVRFDCWDIELQFNEQVQLLEET